MGRTYRTITPNSAEAMVATILGPPGADRARRWLVKQMQELEMQHALLSAADQPTTDVENELKRLDKDVSDTDLQR